MAKNDIKISCKNIFKHTEKEEIKKKFTDKWVDIIRLLEKHHKEYK